MIDSDDQTNRQTIPRWLSIKESRLLGELGAAPRPPSAMQSGLIIEANHFLDAEFRRATERWTASNALEDAEELIGIALLAGRLDDPQAERAGLALVERAGEDDARLQFVRRVLARNTGPGGDSNLPVEEAQIRIEIAKRKRLLELNPRDALRLAESALLYVNVGQTRSAWTLLRRALILRPDDRYVLRAASRFFVHVGEPDEAQHFLSTSKATLSDPWLRSALFAVQAASGRAVSGWRKARSLLGDMKFSPRDLSELAVQMGSMEYDDGSRKQAIRMLRQGAVSPTENAIAQIGWVARHRPDFKHVDLKVDISLSEEASAYTAYEQSMWTEVVRHCSDWRKIEPFSVRPAILATFIGCVSMMALDEAAMVGAYGLLANPKNKTLLNNLAAVRALQGRFADARHLLDRARASIGEDEDDVVVTATAGLIDFREGKFASGIDQYASAIDKARKAKNFGLEFRAICYLSREVARVDPEQGRVLLDQIDSTFGSLTKQGATIPKDITVMREQIAEMLRVSVGRAQALQSIASFRLRDVIGDTGAGLIRDD
ncbi:tetratricopeptide repeat protein [Rhizobium leguminosarum]|uniref:tetratricopeptide repeat protein n=1 Tax=Rhizobium leguminosarum TaxID=384 RepID=UPI00103AB4E4|nr:tetratricopeptide repeat protein [Rhizobium leguminosarum]TBZ79688.1 tetratricopeptide repeat protein [Rhizobium leguminosarum bv. viciae]TBZ97050.1 tetratricopeptide repeat protein [Rhizobium leguminosarum bv. viciae]